MARPRRSTQYAFFDVFADMALEDQKASLRIMEQIHRLAVRDAAKGRRDEMDPAVIGRSHAPDMEAMREPEDGRDGRDDLDDRDPMQIAAERTPPRE